MSAAYIYDAVRTPRGKGQAKSDTKPGGGLSEFYPHELVSQLTDAIAERNGPDVLPSVGRLILGCVGQVGAQGAHIALVSKLASQLNNHAAAKSLNNYCASGLTAVNDASLWAMAGFDDLSLAGGVEMLSRVPFLADHASFTDGGPVSRDLNYLPPIMGAELMANLEGYTKADLDALTARSHQRAARAWKDGHYESGVIPIKRADGTVPLNHDEWIRADFTPETLGTIPPAFGPMGAAGFHALMLQHYPDLKRIIPVHSIANTPGLSDGAALVLVGSRKAGEAAGLKPRARILALAEQGGDPILQFGAGFKAMETALTRAGLSLDHLDLIEFMEAFAAPPLRFERVYEPDINKVNVNGGHLAMGHPMGATGAVLTTTLLHELERREADTGMVVCSGANGIGSALIMARC